MSTVDLTDPLYDQLTTFLQTATTIQQRTPAWHAARSTTVGGSSIGTLLGVGFNTIEQLLAEKLLPQPPKSREEEAFARCAMNWGTVMEDVLCEYTERQFNCKILATEAFFRGEGARKNLAYSPDGLTCMDVQYSSYDVERPGPHGVIVETIPLFRREIVLMEFKCPFTRALRGYMPDYYRPQVLMGLEMLPVATRGVFIEGTIRPCYREQLGGDGHAREYDTKKYGAALAEGQFGITDPTKPPGAPPIDLGYTPALLPLVLHGICAEGWPYEPAKPDAHYYTYILCWKLFAIGKYQVDPQPGFLDALLPAVDKFVNFVEAVRLMPVERRQSMIDVYSAV
jgi:hypothetical protein